MGREIIDVGVVVGFVVVVVVGFVVVVVVGFVVVVVGFVVVVVGFVGSAVFVVIVPFSFAFSLIIKQRCLSLSSST